MLSTVTARALAIGGFAVAWVCREAVDGAVASLWHVMRDQWWFRHDTAEPAAVVAAFGLFNFIWWTVDTRLPSCRRWRLRPWEEDMSHWKWEGGARLKGEAVWYLATLGIYDAMYPRRQLPLEAPSAMRVGLEVLASIVAYDTLFFVAHLAYHKVPVLYKHIHSKHHSKSVMRACEAVRVSVIEQVLDVSCSVMALKIVGGHPLSRMLYNICIVWLITELHCGYDMPWMLSNVIPCGLWAGSRIHEYHHAVGRHCFQKFGTYLDHAFGLQAPPGAIKAFYSREAEQPDTRERWPE